MQALAHAPAFPNITDFPLMLLFPRLLEKLRTLTPEEAAAATLKLPEKCGTENPPPPIANLKDVSPLWALILYLKHTGIDDLEDEEMDQEALALMLLCDAILVHEFTPSGMADGAFEVLRDGSLYYLPEEE